jgi:hypothetical protein
MGETCSMHRTIEKVSLETWRNDTSEQDLDNNKGKVKAISVTDREGPQGC